MPRPRAAAPLRLRRSRRRRSRSRTLLPSLLTRSSLPFPAPQSHNSYKDEKAEEIKEKADNGGFISGIFLEGARWDEERRVLTDSRPKQLYTSMPVLLLAPVQHRVAPTSGIYRCPVYKILSRRGVLATTGHSTNFVMWIEVPGDRQDITNNIGAADQSDWIKAGAAGFLSLKF